MIASYFTQTVNQYRIDYKENLSDQNSTSNRICSIAYKTGESLCRTTMRVISDLVVGVSTGIISFSLLPPANTVFPEKVLKISSTVLAEPVVECRIFLTSILPKLEIEFDHGNATSLNYTEIILTGVLEEVACRGIIQSLLLREVPKLVLKKIAPQHQSLVDHKISKAARIILTSLVFALAHGGGFGDRPGMLASQFFGSCLYSYWSENGTSLIELSAIHFAFDALVFSFSGGMNN